MATQEWIPKLIGMTSYDAQAFYDALVICEFIYGRQPDAGYHSPGFTTNDDNRRLVAEVVGTKPHRLAVRLHHIAQTMSTHREDLNGSLVVVVQMTRTLLATHAS